MRSQIQLGIFFAAFPIHSHFRSPLLKLLHSRVCQTDIFLSSSPYYLSSVTRAIGDVTSSIFLLPIHETYAKKNLSRRPAGTAVTVLARFTDAQANDPLVSHQIGEPFSRSSVVSSLKGTALNPLRYTALTEQGASPNWRHQAMDHPSHGPHRKI